MVYHFLCIPTPYFLDGRIKIRKIDFDRVVSFLFLKKRNNEIVRRRTISTTEDFCLLYSSNNHYGTTLLWLEGSGKASSAYVEMY